MAIDEPPTDVGLWTKVRALSGWPEADEGALSALADGWRSGGQAFTTTASFDDSPVATTWPDVAGEAYRA